MTKQVTTEVGFAFLSQYMTNEYRTDMIMRVLGYVRSATPAARNRLDTVLKATRRIHQDKNVQRMGNKPLSLKPHQLEALISESSQSSDELMGAVLQIWLEQQASLQDRIRLYLQQKGLPLAPISAGSRAFPSHWSPAVMKDAADEFCAISPASNWHDVALMLCCLTGQGPLDTEGGEDLRSETTLPDPAETTVSADPEPTPTPETPSAPVAAPAVAVVGESENQPTEHDMRPEPAEQGRLLPETFKQILAALEAMPAEAEEWHRVEHLVDSVREMAKTKLQERDAGRVRLRTAIDQMIEEFQAELPALGLIDVLAWRADDWPHAQADPIATAVEKLMADLRQYTVLHRNPPFKLTERREYSRQVAELAERILASYQKIAATRLVQAVESADVKHAELEPNVHAVVLSVEAGAIEEPSSTSLPHAELKALTPSVEEHTAVAPEVAEAVLAGIVPEPKDHIATPAEETAVETTPAQEDVSRAQEDDNSARPQGIAVVGKMMAEPAPPVAEAGVAAADQAVGQTSQLMPDTPTVLLPIREAAALAQTESTTHWHHLAWALIAEDDLPGAYWLLRSLAARGVPVPVADWLIAVVQGGRWLSVDSSPLVDGISTIFQEHTLGESEVEELLGLSAALKAALIAPATGLANWIRIPRACPGLHDLVAAARQFATAGWALRPEVLLGAAGFKQLEIEIKNAAENVRRWLADAPSRRTKLQRASNVWRELVGQTGMVYGLLQPIIVDRRDQVARIRADLACLRDRDFVLDLISQSDREATSKAYVITGDARDQIVRYAHEAYETANLWCQLVQREQSVKGEGDRLIEHTSRLRTAVQKALPGAQAAVRALHQNQAARPDLAAAAECLGRTLAQLQIWMTLKPSTVLYEGEAWDQLSRGRASLEQALSRRLLWLPQVDLKDDGSPEVSALRHVAPVLRDACLGDQTTRAAYRGWLRKQDYRFVRDLLDWWFQDESDLSVLEREYREALDGSRTGLRYVIDQTSAVIEQAFFDGVIPSERSQYEASLQGVKVDDVLNFRRAHEDLQLIRDEINDRRRKRLDEQIRTWTELRQKFETTAIEAESLENLSQRVQAAVGAGQTRILDEYLSQIREALDYGHPIAVTDASPETPMVLEAFLKAEPLIREWLDTGQGLTSLLSQPAGGIQVAGVDFSTVKTSGAAEAIEAWRSLKQQGRGAMPPKEQLSKILNFLGFDVVPSLLGDASSSFAAPYLQLRAEMSTVEAVPVAQFGSQAQGRYDVVCLWDRSGADVVRNWILQAATRTPHALVVYLGSLALEQRRSLRRMSIDRGLACLVLDEVLLTFLAGQPAPRLSAWFQCVLPFTSLNPYAGTGHVPREMFFGRTVMSRALQRQEGPCIVYGGRQLGKTALLNRVQQEFHQPEQKRYAWVDDIKLLGDPMGQQPPEALWRKLREGFKEHGLLSPKVTTDRPEEIRRYLREAMLADSERQVLVMLDEADNFLDADCQGRFQVVEELRVLMRETKRRFRIVFAGLHAVQRFQGIPNQPLTQFGAPLCVEPLEPEAAAQLVRQPLEALGYQIADSSVVMKVLSYTNYHAGLIQLMCEHLVKHLQATRGRDLPPYPVGQRDIDAVYRKLDVRQGILDRFKWTLELDVRYQVIAWTVIYDQATTQDGYARAYTAKEILERVRYWWPQGFDGIENGEFRGLLDEMRGLGIIVRGPNGEYRLRSPNLVRLISAISDIEDDLLRLATRSSVIKYDAESHHAPLDETARRYSPLTQSQEKELRRTQFGVGLILASGALGMDLLPDAFARFVPADDTGDDVLTDCASIPPEIGRRTGQMEGWLRKYAEQNRKKERMVVYQSLANDAGNLFGRIQESLEFCRLRQSAQGRYVRVLFVFGPHAAWTWLNLEAGRREALEKQCDAVVDLKCWSLAGVRQRLTQQQKMDMDDVCEAVLRGTGGWPLLLDELFDRCSDRSCSDMRPNAEKLSLELKVERSPLGDRFVKAVGLDVSDTVMDLARLVLSQGRMPLQSVTPAMIGARASLTAQECAAAVEYLRRLGCLSEGGENLVVDQTLAGLVARL